MRLTAHRVTRFKTFAIKIVIVCLLMSVTWWGYSNWIIIKTAECNFGSEPCPTVVMQHLDAIQNYPITRFKSQAFAQQIQGLSPFFADVSVETRLPASVLLTITPATEIAEVRVSSQSAGLVITDTLMVTREVDGNPSGLPKVIYPGLSNIQVGSHVSDEQVVSIIELLKQLNQNYIVIEGLQVEMDKISAQLNYQTSIYFNLSKDFDQQIRAAQLILNKQFERPIRIIDVRFEKPTITFVQ